jgi:NADPH-dependent glutamate synthase beta subunit-like oxidoreductase
MPDPASMVCRLTLLSGTVPNEEGRVERPGTYVTGWIKRGPKGVIGTNRQCAMQTVTTLFEDWNTGKLTPSGRNSVAFGELIAAKVPQAFGIDGWKRIDAQERAAAQPGQPEPNFPVARSWSPQPFAKPDARAITSRTTYLEASSQYSIG